VIATVRAGFSVAQQTDAEYAQLYVDNGVALAGLRARNNLPSNLRLNISYAAIRTTQKTFLF